MRFMAIAALLLATASPVSAAWQVAKSKHFVVYSDDSAKNLLEYTTRLERFDKAFRVFREFKDGDIRPETRVTIFFHGTVTDMEKLAHRRNVAGFYLARAGAPVAFVPSEARQVRPESLTSQQIFFHEYTHHLMLTNWTGLALPGWFVEGFAEFHATAVMKDDGSVIFGARPQYRNYTIARKELMPVKRLLNPGPKKLSPEEMDAFYGRGWLLTHYLTFDEERRKWLADYVKALSNQKPGETAVLGHTDNLDGKLESYLRRPAYPSILFNSDQLPIGEVKVSALSAAESAALPLVMRSTAGISKEEVSEVVALARKVALSYPNDPVILNELAEAEFDAGEFAASQAAAERAIAADPASVHALLYRGYAALAIAKKGEVKDPATWKIIRRYFLDANKANPEDPRPLIAYYDSFGAANAAVTPNAADGLYYAFALAPYDLELRMKVGKLALIQGKKDLARTLISPAANNPEAAYIAELASKLILLIDANDIAGALAEYKRVEEEAAKKDKEAKGK